MPQLTRRIHEIKVNQIVDAQLLQLQHNRAEIRAQNLRIRVLLHLAPERPLRVQAEALSRLGAARAARALLRARLRNGRHQQRLDTDARVVDLEMFTNKRRFYFMSFIILSKCRQPEVAVNYSCLFIICS